MNKIKIGKFLKELRIENNQKLIELSNEFEKNYFSVSPNAISKWERGESVPDIDHINFLANYYKISVDEILNGEKLEHESFNEKYTLHHEDWYTLCGKDFDGVTAYLTEQRKLVHQNFYKLLDKYLLNEIGFNEKEEFHFLIMHYFIYPTKFEYKTVLKQIREIRDNKDLDIKEKRWESMKYLYPIQGVELKFSDLCDEYYKEKYIEEHFLRSPDWVKDLILTTIEICNPVAEYWNNSSNLMKKYKEINNKDFDEELITKNTIKWLIEHGACINKNYLGYFEGTLNKKRIIDEIEKMHNQIHKPISLVTGDFQNLNFYQIENNPYNQLIINYKHSLLCPMIKYGFSEKEAIDLIMENSETPNNVVYQLAAGMGVDLNNNDKEIKADFDMKLFGFRETWRNFHNEIILKRTDLEYEIEKLKNFLKNGEVELNQLKINYIGGKDPTERLKFALKTNFKISYKAFLSGRLKKETNKLINDIDKLSITEIREKYFTLRGAEND